jgi:hypothetical protein
MVRSDQQPPAARALLRRGWHRPAASLMPVAVSLWMLAASCSAQAESGSLRGKVLLVRGAMTVFSLGLDDLAKKLACQELDVQVVPASMSGLAARQVAQQYARGELRGPLVLIGHSLGGDLLPGLAQQFACFGQTVDLMMMIDSTNPSAPPRNVRRCVNLYQSNSSPAWFPVFRGVPIRATNPETQLVNVDIRQLSEREEAARLNHFNIEASNWIHALVIREVQYVVGSRVQRLDARARP